MKPNKSEKDLLKRSEEWSGERPSIGDRCWSGPIAALIIFLIAALCVFCSGCAHTTLYQNGRPIARFEGDMTGLVYRQAADGSVELSGNINHSAATKAQGEAAAGKIGAAGAAIAASGLISILK